MNIKKEAKLYYGDGNFDILKGGDHVLCAVTGQTIPLSELKYWSVDLQEAYADGKTSLIRHQQVLNGK